MSAVPIPIPHQYPGTEGLADLLHLHATLVNKTGGSETFNAGAEQYHPRLNFDLRWCQALEAIRYDTQSHRILYRGHAFNIKDWDDYMEQHLTVRLVGEAYG